MLWPDERAILHVGEQHRKAANRMKALAKANVATRVPAAASAPAVPERVYLRMLGERVREARARRGMTRKILAKDSGVSERYLAQLEGGLGNISILLLRLIMEGPEPPVELMHTTELLRRLGPGEIRRAHQMLLKNFSSELGAADANERRSRIALIGLRGAGKSTLGAKLAGRLGVPFIELDRVIEKECGVTLSVIFDLYGQSGFRRLERQCLEQILERQPRFVLSTGGSLVSEHATFERLLAACFTVWLRATPEDHMQRVIAQGDMRPMAENRESMADLRRILSVREPLYGEADVAVDTSGRSLSESFDAILKAVQVTAAQRNS
jgi:XRE family aerobic/anaerobic benzoate catabolism transcriptional regulator